MVEILIALFVFLIGVLGILSLFPVAMSTAGKAIGETRANILAQSALAQLKFDCSMAYESGTCLASGAGTLARASSTTAFTDYYVTLTSGNGRGQSRRINGNAGTTLNVSPNWTVTPALNDTYVITRLGLPDAPFPTALNGYGLDRNVVIRSLAGHNGVCLGYPAYDPTTDPAANTNGIGFWQTDPFHSGANVVYPLVGSRYDTTTVPANPSQTAIANSTANGTLTDSARTNALMTWSNTAVFSPSGFPISPWPFVNLTAVLAPTAGPVQARRVASHTSTALTVIQPWLSTPPVPTSTYYRVGWPESYLWTRRELTGTSAAPGSLTTLISGGLVAGAHVGRYLVITSGAGAHQARLITANDATTFTVTPEFTVIPTGGTNFEVLTSRAYLLVTSGRAAGRIFPIAADYSSGIYADGGADPLKITLSATTLTDTSKTWTLNLYKNHLVRIRMPGGNHQVRQITSNTASQLTVSPDWSPVPPAGSAYEIAPGHFVVCAAADFDRHGVAAAERPNSNMAAGYGTSLQDGTTCTILGVGVGTYATAGEVPVTICPFSDTSSPPAAVTTRQPFMDATASAVNVFNRVGMAWRIAPDTFGNSYGYGSEYSCIAIFSDSGVDPQDGVRADVFVYRNFSPAKELSDNQKPVGYVSGYIERP